MKVEEKMGDIDREMLRMRCLIRLRAPVISQDYFFNLHVMDFTNIFMQFYFNDEIYSDSFQCLYCNIQCTLSLTLLLCILMVLLSVYNSTVLSLQLTHFKP